MHDQLNYRIPNMIDQDLNTSSIRKGKHSRKSSSSILIICMFSLIILSVVASAALLQSGIQAGATQLINSFTAALESEKDSAFQMIYNKAFARAEQRNHVSNRVQISIGSLEERQRLEVLRANDVEIITEDRDDNSGNVTVWLEVEGEGIFVVDLQAAEFVVDNERKSVLVRIPKPELTNVRIIRTTRRLFADDYANGSYGEGVDLAVKQRNEASLQIEKALLSNQYIYGNAKDVSKSMLRNLVLQLNPDIENLNVEVEFFE